MLLLKSYLLNGLLLGVEGGVVCRAEEFPVGCKGFSFCFYLNLDGLDFL